MPYDPVRAAIDWQRLQADLSLFGLVCERTREDLYTEGLELRREIEALLSETSDAEFADLRETVNNASTERRIAPCKASTTPGASSATVTLMPSAIAIDVDCRRKPETATVALKRRRQPSISLPSLFTAESPHVFDAGSGDTGAEPTGIKAVILESAFRESPALKKQKKYVDLEVALSPYCGSDMSLEAIGRSRTTIIFSTQAWDPCVAPASRNFEMGAIRIKEWRWTRDVTETVAEKNLRNSGRV
ncbi:hypothetical protein DFH06DRAFT_1415639 [Mycena polygramma]|nr:hypothetical protein DFH06DRAFT_1415639 [Mycena polygramma]